MARNAVTFYASVSEDHMSWAAGWASCMTCPAIGILLASRLAFFMAKTGVIVSTHNAKKAQNRRVFVFCGKDVMVSLETVEVMSRCQVI